MARRDQVDVVASPLHEMEHHGGEAVGVHFLALPQMTDREILAEGTEKIAGTEEDRSGAGRPHQRGFFAEVGMKTGHAGSGAGPADTQLAA